MKLKEEILSCDVLVAGGGIGGMMAAITAADCGASVIVVEKANTMRSGSGATGNDHFMCYNPDVHPSLEAFVKEVTSGSLAGAMLDNEMIRRYAERSFEVAQDWHKWGINMQPHGYWEFNGHTLPGHTPIHMRYDGRNQKPILTREALKRGVKIENHSPVIEYITDNTGRVCGLIALDISTEEPMLKVYKAKAIVTAQGSGTKLYPSSAPGWLFNACNCPASGGEGRAAGLRIGAEMTRMDMLHVHSGPKYMERCGKGTWIGVYRNKSGDLTGPFGVEVATRDNYDLTGDVWGEMFIEKFNNGTGPVYIDTTDTPEEDMDYMTWGFHVEGVSSILDAAEQQGLDFRHYMYEFTRYNPDMQTNGYLTDINGRTNVPGLFALGDECGNFTAGIGGISTYGRIIGEIVAEEVKDIELDDFDITLPKIHETKAFYETFLNRENGASWKELNLAIQQIMDDYAGSKTIKSETKMAAGQKYLKDLRKRAMATLSCKTSHDLMRTIDTLGLLDMGEIIIESMRFRTESRGPHKRSDYTFTNPLNNGKTITIKREVDGSYTKTWRYVR